jgi:hypothetical protein
VNDPPGTFTSQRKPGVIRNTKEDTRAAKWNRAARNISHYKDSNAEAPKRRSAEALITQSHDIDWPAAFDGGGPFGFCLTVSHSSLH